MILIVAFLLLTLIVIIYVDEKIKGDISGKFSTDEITVIYYYNKNKTEQDSEDDNKKKNTKVKEDIIIFPNTDTYELYFLKNKFYETQKH